MAAVSTLISPGLPSAEGLKPVAPVVTEKERPPQLDARFAALKREVIKPENEQAVSESYERLLKELEKEAERLGNEQQAAIPEVAWSDVVANGNKIPEDVASKARDSGCIILRGVVEEEQALKWKAELLDYTQRHRAVGGRPASNPTFWLLYWTRPQVQARSHPEILKAMKATGQLWNVNDETLPIDITSQVNYADRFRIRKPGDREYTLKAHLDSSAIERWEDPAYRSNYEKIFEGKWEEYEPWCLDKRPDAKVDLYRSQGSCSSFRSLQGWLSLCWCGPGEGTLRLLPSLKLSTAYIMLRPFFLDEKLDLSEPTFPGSKPGSGQLHPTNKWHPHLQMAKTMISVPKVNPGDYVFWHIDLCHEVEDQHNGELDSSVFYNANIPLCTYNIQNMLTMRKSFKEVVPPPDFYLDCGGPFEVEAEHDDHGAREDNILTLDGRRALGLAEFDENEPGLTEGQRKIRKLANEAMKLQ